MRVEFELEGQGGDTSAHRREMSGIPRPEDVIEIEGQQFIVAEIVWTLGQCGVDLRVKAKAMSSVDNVIAEGRPR